MKDDLGDRMKSYYEDAYRSYLPMKIPVILRLDGKSFHSYTKDCQKPFDIKLMSAMNNVAIELCVAIQGAVIAYVQSDEISILIKNYNSIEQQGWFNNNLQKMISVSAGIASSTMTVQSANIFGQIKPAIFDCRAFILPEFEVLNYFLWRQNDASRNSVQMLARSLYSHKKCENKKNSELQEMCHEKGFNWNDLPTDQKRGRCIVRVEKDMQGIDNKTGKQIKFNRHFWEVDSEIPIFSKDRTYIDKYLAKPLPPI